MENIIFRAQKEEIIPHLRLRFINVSSLVRLLSSLLNYILEHFRKMLRNIIIKYDIRNQDLWIQSDNVPTQYKKNAFLLLQKLTKELNLRILCTYGAAGHWKGAVLASKIFCEKITWHMISFSTKVVGYLSITCQ